jgi:hypothetical protein
MTTLNPDPRAVSLVQVASSLPMFLCTVPAGGLADMVSLPKPTSGRGGSTKPSGLAFVVRYSRHRPWARSPSLYRIQRASCGGRPQDTPKCESPARRESAGPGAEARWGFGSKACCFRDRHACNRNASDAMRRPEEHGIAEDAAPWSRSCCRNRSGEGLLPPVGIGRDAFIIKLAITTPP